MRLDKRGKTNIKAVESLPDARTIPCGQESPTSSKDGSILSGVAPEPMEPWFMIIRIIEVVLIHMVTVVRRPVKERKSPIEPFAKLSEKAWKTYYLIVKDITSILNIGQLNKMTYLAIFLNRYFKSRVVKVSPMYRWHMEKKHSTSSVVEARGCSA